MGLSNAERQARWRERQKAKTAERIRELEAALRNEKPQPQAPADAALKARIRELEAENRSLRNGLGPGYDQQSYRARFEALGRKATAKKNGPVTLKEVNKVWVAFQRLDNQLCALEERAGAPALTKKRAAIQARIDRPGTEGERAAAVEAMRRVDAAGGRSRRIVEPEPMPQTAEEMLVRKTMKKPRGG